MTYWAHTDRGGLPLGAPGSHWQPLEEHLRNVALGARRLAAAAAPGYTQFHDLAEACGLLHDFGKYSDCFQRMIVTGQGKCVHAMQGAAIAFDRLQASHAASAIAGHHAGLPDLDRLRESIPPYRAEALELIRRARRDSRELAAVFDAPAPRFEKIPPDRFDLFTRMLLSCLVDADRLDTAGRTAIQAPLEAAKRLDRLLAGLRQLARESPGGALKTARREVLEDCLRAAAYGERIFSLSVPTGGGKTLSAMAFALRRAALSPERYRRIVVVVPYLSMMEQRAAVYAQVFGPDAVLEHHAGALPAAADRGETYLGPGERPETENWDAPLVVTASARFFESLFSNHPADLRRLHNLARSIVILDEVEILPRRLLGPLLDVTSELAAQWGCCFVLSTATKPAFEKPASAESGDLRWPAGTMREMVRAPGDLQRRLRRAAIEWRIGKPVDWPQVAGWMWEHRQALCVVNLPGHAVQLFDQVAGRSQDLDSVFHLSTRMCPAHRLRALAAIRGRLTRDRPCLVVSTQSIEGVDVDFPIAFRALGPLDAIVQVAGRPAGRLVVFQPLDDRTPSDEYRLATEITATLATRRDIQPDDLDAIREFFEAYYGHADLGADWREMRRLGKFETLAREFERINSRTLDVFVPYRTGKALIGELCERGRLDADLRRRLQPYVVGLAEWEFAKARDTVLSEVAPGSNIWVAPEAAYSDARGLLVAEHVAGRAELLEGVGRRPVR